MRSIPHVGKDCCSARNAPRLSDALSAVLFGNIALELLPVLCTIGSPEGRPAEPFLGKIQKSPHLRWHQVMRRKDPEYATWLRVDHGEPLRKHMPQAARLDILTDQPCRQERDP